MFELINLSDTALRPIDGLYRGYLFAAPYLKAVWQVVTAERTQRFLRAIGMAVLVIATIVLCGLLELGRLAVREATIAFQTQIEADVVECVKSELLGGSETIEAEGISRQTGVRILRRVATQQGILNAGRMRKPELLAVLELG